VTRTPAPVVLLVDDNAAFVENLAEILADAGYDCRCASSCAQALEAARGGFDVALVDLRLPDGEGTLLAPRLKAIVPEGEVVLLTGFASVESAAAAVQAGAWAYLVKPCATPELLLILEQAMRQVRLHREKRELARRAQVAERLAAVGTLTAGLSHEIRNPLNAAALQLSVLERRLRRLPAEAQGPLMEPLSLVRDEIRRLDHVLEDFLQFARPREVSREPVELVPVLARVLDLLSENAERRGVKVERHFASAPPVAGDEARLQQVVMNLALNALEALEHGGHLRLSCRPADSDDDVELVVEDDGPGIEPELADRIFEPFFTTKASGSGLGLPIVNAIVTQHGGTIRVSRSSLGGARIAVTLPRAT
jgi:signal transduction histidine kinase